MSEDKSLKEVFEHAKKPVQPKRTDLNPVSEAPIVHVTYVEHFANFHPSSQNVAPSDLVYYANGTLTLSQSHGRHWLAATLKLWVNNLKPGKLWPTKTPPDIFVDSAIPTYVLLSINESGQVKTGHKLILGPKSTTMAPLPNLTYSNGIFVSESPGQVVSLSFTLDWTPL